MKSYCEHNLIKLGHGKTAAGRENAERVLSSEYSCVTMNSLLTKLLCSQRAIEKAGFIFYFSLIYSEFKGQSRSIYPLEEMADIWIVIEECFIWNSFSFSLVATSLQGARDGWFKNSYHVLNFHNNDGFLLKLNWIIHLLFNLFHIFISAAPKGRGETEGKEPFSLQCAPQRT